MAIAVPYRPDHVKKMQWLLAQADANGGLAPVELDRFYADDALAARDPFGEKIPQVLNGIWPTVECVYDELGVREDYWRYDNDEAWRLELNKAYNDKAERVLGKRFLPETKSDPTQQWPAVKTLADVFEAKNVWHDRSWWLMESAHDEDQLNTLLDRVEKRLGSLREYILPPNWESEKARLNGLGLRSPLYRWQRGPVTFATSVYGPERFILLVLDNPDLAVRFSKLILRTMLGIARIQDEEAGYTPETAPHGFGFADDNCCLMTPDMYDLFAFPITSGVFARYSPNADDWRYQHSDSGMGHLLPILGRLNYSGVNFGPTVLASEIREHMPRTVIEGQLAPFTISRNEHESIVLEFLRDFEMTRQTRGLKFATAGSVNNGTLLSGIRLVMSAIQHFGRYDC